MGHGGPSRVAEVRRLLRCRRRKCQHRRRCRRRFGGRRGCRGRCFDRRGSGMYQFLASTSRSRGCGGRHGGRLQRNRRICLPSLLVRLVLLPLARSGRPPPCSDFGLQRTFRRLRRRRGHVAAVRFLRRAAAAAAKAIIWWRPQRRHWFELFRVRRCRGGHHPLHSEQCELVDVVVRNASGAFERVACEA